MKISEIMKTPVHCVLEDERVDRCAQLMRDQGVGFLPVVDGFNHLAGIVTDRDLAIRVLAEARDPATPVCDVMTGSRLVTCAPGDDLSVAESRMARHKVSRIAVVDELGHLEGVVSLSDISQQTDVVNAGLLLSVVSHREAT